MSEGKSVAVVQRPMEVAAPHYSFRELQQMAVTFAKSGMFAVKTPEAALSLLMIAEAEHIHPAQAMLDYDVIKERPALKASALLARFQRSGGKVKWLQASDECVEGTFEHPLSPEPVTVKWDTARVTKAGLGGREMHQKFPLQMKRARCISEGVKATAPQTVQSGIYTVEEVRDMTDAEVESIVTIDKAVELAVAMPEERVQQLIDSLDVKTRPELVTAYNAALAEMREAKDDRAIERLKGTRDMMLTELEEQQIQ